MADGIARVAATNNDATDNLIMNFPLHSVELQTPH
jgi:hypothetical protein